MDNLNITKEIRVNIIKNKNLCNFIKINFVWNEARFSLVMTRYL